MKCTLLKRCTTSDEKNSSNQQHETKRNAEWKRDRDRRFHKMKKAHEKSIFQPNQNWNSRSLGTLKCYLYYIYRLSFVGSLHRFMPFFALSHIFSVLVFHRLILFFFVFFSVSCFIDMFSFRCWFFFCFFSTLSRFKQIRLLVRTVFFMLFQFNGYFLFLLIELLQNSNSAKSIRQKNANR